jgi:probable HAF family extracellular repeat protein
MNNLGEVVGPSFSSPGPTSGSPRAFLYRDGKMHDLNALVPPDSPLYLLIAYGINDAGQIAGFGVNSNGDIHAYLATPCNRDQVDKDLRTAPSEGAAFEGAVTTERPRPPFGKCSQTASADAALPPGGTSAHATAIEARK